MDFGYLPKQHNVFVVIEEDAILIFCQATILPFFVVFLTLSNRLLLDGDKLLYLPECTDETPMKKCQRGNMLAVGVNACGVQTSINIER